MFLSNLSALLRREFKLLAGRVFRSVSYALNSTFIPTFEYKLQRTEPHPHGTARPLKLRQ